MQFYKAHLHTIAGVLPPNVLTSAELEERLKPLYDRLHLPEGRLELMTGIRERRFWNHGAMPSDAAVLAGRAALEKSGLAPSAIQALIFCGVSRDCAEPATSTAVVRKLGLPADTLNFDLSNACLGVASGMMVLANMIETGAIDCGMALTGENGGPLVENTIARLNADLSMTRQALKFEFASLTIGSAASAVILSREGAHAIRAAAGASDCANDNLCRGDAAGGMTDGSAPVMRTDSHELMVQGIQVAQRMWSALRKEAPWGDGLPDIVCGHQVGKVHRDLLFEQIGVPTSLDFPIFPETGNCGSASLPLAVCLAEERGALKPGMRLAMLGIGSGINSFGMAIDW